jgi:hypothetical protein
MSSGRKRRRRRSQSCQQDDPWHRAVEESICLFSFCCLEPFSLYRRRFKALVTQTSAGPTLLDSRDSVMLLFLSCSQTTHLHFVTSLTPTACLMWHSLSYRQRPLVFFLLLDSHMVPSFCLLYSTASALSPLSLWHHLSTDQINDQTLSSELL